MTDDHGLPVRPPPDFRADWLPDYKCAIPTWVLLADRDEIIAHYGLHDAAESECERGVEPNDASVASDDTSRGSDD